ncbi:MAG TPA: hypothetical protein VGL56_08410 [Fimbriimonadaceae bacterium]|jgi:hypothetical protein
MYEIQIPDHVYEQAAKAAEAQHVSLQEFVVEALQLHAEPEDPDDFDYLFTPAILTEIDKSAQEAKDGKSFPIEQVKERRATKRKAWEENHAI